VTLNIIYEDRDFLAVNKPSGIVVHPDERHKSETLIQEILKKYPEIKSVGEDPARPGLIHRLDKDTSGILLVAKNQKTFQYFKEAFQNNRVKKTYLTLLAGRIKNKEGLIDLPIGRSKKSPMRRIAGKGGAGKIRSAITKYKVLKYLDGFSFCEAKPLTGRTHQIRAHFAAIGHPVVCDKIYSGKKFICPGELARQFLHAYKLEFVSPSGSKLLLESGLPEDLEKVIKTLSK
jgi:23S rRNA pseudouridine1911/1915/1917 synthase